jgi:soluble cytochrome b562
MKIFTFITTALVLISCNQQNNDVQKMQATIDSLQKQIAEAYKTGFGEFMSGIQTHHAKLWFAGLNENWALADFEVHEIQEALDDVQKFCSDRPEVKHMGMMNPAIDTVNYAIQQKNLQLFKNSFILLTNTCNNCHKATDHGFNVVIVPTNLPVVNQDFKSIK